MNNTTNWHHTIIPGARCIIPWFSYVWYMCVFFALNCCSFYSSTSSTPSVHADSFILGRYKICGNNTTTQAAMLYQVDSSSSTMPCRCAGLWQAQRTLSLGDRRPDDGTAERQRKKRKRYTWSVDYFSGGHCRPGSKSNLVCPHEHHQHNFLRGGFLFLLGSSSTVFTEFLVSFLFLSNASSHLTLML